MSSHIRIIRTCIAALALGPAFAAADAEGPPTLYHRFDFLTDGRGQALSIDLVPDGWHVGRADGPAADAAQLDATLAALARIRVRGRCSAVIEGPTEYPCGFALSRLEVDGLDAQRLDGIAGEGAPTLSAAVVEVGASAEEAALGAAARVERLVEVVASVADASGARRGGHLGFSFRAVSNALRPSRFDAHSGVVVLQPGRRAGVRPAGPQAAVAPPGIV